MKTYLSLQHAFVGRVGPVLNSPLLIVDPIDRRMYEFLDRLISVALPRVRDFRGISGKAFDGRGTYTLGVREQLIFPEIDFNKVDKTRGMNISIVTTAKNDEQARSLLKALGMPFRQ